MNETKHKDALPVVLTVDEVDHEFSTSYEAVEFLTRLDWDLPASVLAYKHNVTERALVRGIHLVYWDATSFLQAGAAAGIWKVEFRFGACYSWD